MRVRVRVTRTRVREFASGDMVRVEYYQRTQTLWYDTLSVNVFTCVRVRVYVSVCVHVAWCRVRER